MKRTIVSDILIAAFMFATVVGTQHTPEVHMNRVSKPPVVMCWTEPSADNERICGNPKLAPQNATDWSTEP